VQRLPKVKLTGCDYGLLSEQEVQNAPWEEAVINLIGPWKVKVNGHQGFHFLPLILFSPPHI
jgi:hypothetical protein